VIEALEQCPACKRLGMYAWNPSGSETARACQFCPHVEERPQQTSAPVAVDRAAQAAQVAEWLMPRTTPIIEGTR
jgi:hypothetical protein